MHFASDREQVTLLTWTSTMLVQQTAFALTRIDLKILLLTYKRVNGIAAEYLCNPVVPKVCPRTPGFEVLEHVRALYLT